MTVGELIDQLQGCDMPNAEVIIQTKGEDMGGHRIAFYNGVREVYWRETAGPVVIHGEEHE